MNKIDDIVHNHGLNDRAQRQAHLTLTPNTVMFVLVFHAEPGSWATSSVESYLR